MQKRLFGNTGREVAVIGQGTWYGARDERKPAIAALRRGIELGMTHIDTAEMYLSGKAEEWVAEAIEGQRDEIFLVSKVLPSNASRKGTVAACEASLRRLKSDRLDCYLLHWRGSYPLKETIDAFEQLQAAGKILSWGVSNFDVSDLDEAGRPACNQVLYHLKERAVEHAVLPWCEKNQCALVAYSPFGHDDFPGGISRQVALRFLLRRRCSFVIPKSSSVEHTIENAGAGGLEITEAQIAQLEKAFPLGRRPRQLPTL